MILIFWYNILSFCEYRSSELLFLWYYYYYYYFERVQEGICYHLFSRGREKLLSEFPLPEIKRTRMEEVILHLKALQLGSVKPFLSKVLDPPDEDVIVVSIKVDFFLFFFSYLFNLFIYLNSIYFSFKCDLNMMKNVSINFPSGYFYLYRKRKHNSYFFKR